MTRIILVSGRGGAGKTTVAAATALAASRRGLRTLVLSFDLTHGLGAAMGQEGALFSGPRGVPVGVNDHLSFHEVDVGEELRRGWNGGQGGLSALVDGGLERVSAEEVAMTAEVAHVVMLLRLGEYVRAQQHDLLVVDCPSTGAALHLLNTVPAMRWYARKQEAPTQPGRKARLLAASLHGADASLEVRDRLNAVDALLRDPTVTTLRLVTTADTVSVQETQRAYTYFSLHELAVDCVVINRLAQEAQQPHVERLQGAFSSLLVLKVPHQAAEVVGEKPLDTFAEQLYQGEDPVSLTAPQAPLGIRKAAVDAYTLEVRLPFVAKSEVELTRRGAEFVIQVGAVRRNVVLPRMIALLPTSGAHMEGDRLIVSFQKERGV
ncbi:ArsA family ATPase [Corallococcus macrosporus]|uniref:arsenite-transporting ATPase n=1 Tax=Corallococcus macrosporus DSM 14697 TaxID=1189310 RepID=A0A250JXL0_9BACT|nr:ArsA-related P-loop ATPase [Corallococcus macrosporus]ATB48585.1 arsenic-transporting ATPase [Corallococcus macrosporus DSM 14697]